jgi:heat shock 70kDa protein 4
MREWLTEYTSEHMPYIGTSDQQEALLSKLSTAEDWLLDGEGEFATAVEYNQKHAELNDIFNKLKNRKEEHKKRPAAVTQARNRLDQLEDETKDLEEKKPWINGTHRQDVLDLVKETREWLNEVVGK